MTKRTAVDRVAKADALAAQRRRALARHERALQRAVKRGDTERAEKARQDIARTRKWLAKQVGIAAKYRPAADLQRAAERLITKARDAERAMAPGRKAEAKLLRRPSDHIAKPETRREKVDSPLTGYDIVHRVVDTISTLHRRRVINEREKRAADIYREAYETVAGSGMAGMTEGGGGGSGAPGKPVPEHVVQAASRLASARQILDLQSHSIVAHVCGEGLTITEYGRRINRTSERQLRTLGARLRTALSRLADTWFPAERATGRGGRITAYLGDGAKPSGGSEGVIERGSVAHVSIDGVKRSG